MGGFAHPPSSLRGIARSAVLVRADRVLVESRQGGLGSVVLDGRSADLARASERERELFAADRYQEYLLCHGLSVEMTEALAELWHRRIREEWGFAAEDGPTLAGLFRQQYRGSRYSWGYPACPDLEDRIKLAAMLEPERIGVKLSEELQLHPEQSTDAFVLHHPEAKYFNV